MEKKCKKVKWLSGEALQIAVKRREAKAKEKRKDISMPGDVPDPGIEPASLMPLTLAGGFFTTSAT